MTLVAVPMKEIESAERNWVTEFLLEYGENTRAAYASDLRRFFDWCKTLGTVPQNASRSVCASFSRHEIELEGYSPSTASRRLAAISAYYNYGLAEGYIEQNPMASVRRPRTSRESVSTGLDKLELGGLIEAARNDSIQSHALILVLAYNGLRISEALAINIDDLGSERGKMTIRVHRKGGKESLIPLNPITAGVVARLSTTRYDGPLFRDAENRRMNRQQAWRLVRKLTKNNFHPHSLRHTFATSALEAGASLHEVQAACDHADPRTTERYLHSIGNLDNHPTFLLGAEDVN